MKNILPKKSKALLIKVATILVLTATIPTTTANANMLNKFKQGFYFEKYETPEEAKAELLKLHPIGSDVSELVRTLEKAGAVEEDVYAGYNKMFNALKKSPENQIHFRYEHQLFPKSFFSRRWHSAIIKDNQNMLTDISFDFQQGE